MRIGIYIDVLQQTEKSGIARHVEGLLSALARLDSKNTYLLYYGASSLKSPDLAKKYNFGPNFKVRRVPFATSIKDQRPRLWWGLVMPFVATLDRIDVFHGPNFFIPTAGPFKRIVTIHDLAFFHMRVHGPGMDRIMQQWTLKSLAAATKVIAVSESTRLDCVNVSSAQDKVVTIYQGFEDTLPSKKFASSPRLSETLGIPKDIPLILYVGTLQPRKNIPVLIKAFSVVKDQIPHQLILAGSKGEAFDDIKNLIGNENLEARVTITGYIDDETRSALYQSADVFVYPSLCEGFGLVLLEAMTAGLPTIAAANSSLMEAGGDSTKYFDTQSPESLSKVLLEVLSSEEVRNSMIKLGHSQTKKFSWDESAKQHLDLYSSVVYEN